MTDREYVFNSREKALECMEERLATLEGLQFHALNWEEIQNKTEITGIRLVLITKEGKSIAVKMNRKTFESLEIEIKRFYDYYARFV